MAIKSVPNHVVQKVCRRKDVSGFLEIEMVDPEIKDGVSKYGSFTTTRVIHATFKKSRYLKEFESMIRKGGLEHRVVKYRSSAGMSSIIHVRIPPHCGREQAIADLKKVFLLKSIR